MHTSIHCTHNYTGCGVQNAPTWPLIWLLDCKIMSPTAACKYVFRCVFVFILSMCVNLKSKRIVNKWLWCCDCVKGIHAKGWMGVSPIHGAYRSDLGGRLGRHLLYAFWRLKSELWQLSGSAAGKHRIYATVINAHFVLLVLKGPHWVFLGGGSFLSTSLSRLHEGWRGTTQALYLAGMHQS